MRLNSIFTIQAERTQFRFTEDHATWAVHAAQGNYHGCEVLLSQVTGTTPFASPLRDPPAVWDQTRVLQGESGRRVTIARRRGQQLYVGIIQAAGPMPVEISLAFLEPGQAVRIAPKTEGI